MSFTNVFGGSTIYPSDVSYLSIALSADTPLQWPLESSGAEDPAARIIDVTPDASGHSVVMPDATLTGAGQTILFNNLSGSYSFYVEDFDGNTLATVGFGEQWQLYLAVTTTAAGTWRVFRFGASTATVQPSALAGFGLTVTGSTLSQSAPVTTFSTTGLTLATSSRAGAFVWNGSGAGTLNLLTAASAGNNYFVLARNAGGGDLTIDPSGTELINGASTLALRPGDSATLITDGATWYTVGLGQEAIFAFDYTSISVTGGNYTLAGSELNRIAYKFVGALTSDVYIIIPATVQQYWITNATTGSFNFYVKISGGAATQVAQNAKGIYYCNGSIVVLASDPTSLSLPVTVAQGGTGSITASGARLNLGISTFADPIVTATTGASVRTTISAAASGANGDITSLTGLTTPLSVAQGGTAATTAGAARTSLGAAASGANGDITSLTGLTTPLSVAQGGTAATTAGAARTSLGGTTVGGNMFTLANPSAITFPRFNADNTVSALDAATFRTAIGAGTGAGTVSSASVVSANGFAGTVATATTTPAITLSTSITGIVKGNGTAISAATAGTDYVAPGAYTTSGLTMATSRLLGRATASTGAAEEISVAGGLTLSAGVLTGTSGTVTSVTGTSPVVSSGGSTPAISMPAATTSVSGYLTSTDWNTFNGKGSGTVTSVGGTGTVNGITLTGTVTTSGSLTLGGTLSGVSLTTQVTGTLPVANGGTGLTTTPANGALDIGNGTGFTRTTLTAGSGVTITNGAGTISIAATSGGGGTVTSASVVSANGFAGTVATATTTPAITLTTSITGVIKGNGTAISAATAGTDYVAPGAYTSSGLTMATSRLLGRTTASTGAAEEISVAGGLTLSAGVLTGTSGTVTSVTGTAPVVSSGGATPAISMAAATTAVSGYLTSTDWTTFNNKGSGTVTSVGFTGGIVSVATATTTPALTVAGTSGGIPYFSSGTTWATSAALAASALVIGGGAGVAPSTTTTGTGVVTALGVAVGSAGAFVVNGGALGTPSSGTVTNLTGTASININGTVGATTAAAGLFTTLGASAAVTLSPASANVVLSPTGTGVVTINPATAGTINNCSIGGTTAAAGTFTTVTGNTSVTSPLVVGGSAVSSTLTVQSTSGAGTTDAIIFKTGSQVEQFRILTGGGITSASLVDAVGYKGMPQNSQTASYTLALTDMGKMVNTTTGGIVIPANASVAFPVGSTVIVYNNSASSQTISITTDTIYLAGTATTGSRTLAQRGLATLVKVDSTTWVASGAGVT